jgi:hypothetical protein
MLRVKRYTVHFDHNIVNVNVGEIPVYTCASEQHLIVEGSILIKVKHKPNTYIHISDKRIVEFDLPIDERIIQHSSVIEHCSIFPMAESNRFYYFLHNYKSIAKDKVKPNHSNHYSHYDNNNDPDALTLFEWCKGNVIQTEMPHKMIYVIVD